VRHAAHRVSNGFRRLSGFTLIELMIVVAIIAVIVAIAIPNLLRSRIQSNEASAASSLRIIAGAQITYHSANSVFAPDFAALGNALPPYLSGNWNVPKSGYLYTMRVSDNDFTVNADPVEFDVTGTKGFFINSSGVVRSRLGGAADVNSTPLGTT